MPDQEEMYTPSQDAKDLYKTHVTQAWTDQQESSDAFDSNLLTLSSAALGLSLVFLKDIVPLENAEWMKTLYFSWICFGGCILATVASLQFAIQAQKAHAVYLRKYYMEGRQEFLDKKSIWSRMIIWCGVAGSIMLVIGVVSTIVFTSKNVKHFREIKRWQKTSSTSKNLDQPPAMVVRSLR